MTSIYTRTGDSGESSVRSERLRKDALVFDVLGDLDELNSWLGVVRDDVPEPDRARLDDVQSALISLSADIAGYGAFATDLVATLERDIDRLSAGPFALRPPAGRIHVARTVCRRAERHLVAFRPDHAGLPFVNRLSDYLYALAERVSKESRP